MLEKIKKGIKVLYYFIGICYLLFLVKPPHVFAFSTGMSASIAVGQSTLTGGGSNQGGLSSSSLNTPASVIIANGKLIVADNGNNRVLIYNSIPASSNAQANIVIGQSDMISGGNNCTQSTLNLGEGGIFFVNGKLFIADSGNNRVLVYNSIPTSNGANASVVIGQNNFTSCTANMGGSVTAATLSAPDSVASDGTQVFISDTGNNRVLLYNSTPTANGASASIAIGQQNLVSSGVNSGGISAATLSSPRGVGYYSGNLIIADTGNNRALVFLSIPTANQTKADGVIGQSSFTANTALQGGSNVSSTTSTPFHISIDLNGRVLIAEKQYNRVTIYSSIPQSNNQAADMVIGQTGFSGSSFSTTAAATLSNPKAVFSIGSQLFIADSSNNRILIYNNSSSGPTIAINNKPKQESDSSLTITGSATVPSPYTIKDVQYAVNGFQWLDATPTDGDFNEQTENFSFNFFPTDNNNNNPGFTIEAKVISSNLDTSGNALFFEPFDLNKPDDGSLISTPYPTFDFSVNTQHAPMSDGLSKYQIWVSNAGTTNWQLYLDNIPTDFTKARSYSENSKKNSYGPTDINGVYDSPAMTATFYENSSHIIVSAKDPQNSSFASGGKQLAGSVKWKVVAVDMAGHTTETGSQFIRFNSPSISETTKFFPLTILFISGVGNLNLTTIDPTSVKDTYSASSSMPTFYGIGIVGATVTITITEIGCTATQNNSCSSTFLTTVNPESRFGINVVDGVMQKGKNYSIDVNELLKQDYVELPLFTLSIK